MTEEKMKAKPKRAPKISKEVALEEFARFGEAMDLDFDETEMDQKELADFKKYRRVCIKAMMDGFLSVNERGEPVLQPSDGSELIVFHEPDGNDMMESDRKPKDHDMAKTYAIIAAVVEDTEERIRKLPQRDQRIIRAIAILTLA